MKLTETEVNGVLKRLADSLSRPRGSGSKVVLFHRENDDYWKTTKTMDKFGFGLEDIMKELT